MGHNLDDEAGRLLGNIVRNRLQYLEKQSVYLASPHPLIPAKYKPLYRLESHEIRTYCRLQGIVPLDARCPLSRGATSRTFKEALDLMESKMPGSKRDFLFTFLDRKSALPSKPPSAFDSCVQCGQPCFSGICSACHLKGKMGDD
jgi:tRNA-5-methyluridine54 2-sulfurtransferase